MKSARQYEWQLASIRSGQVSEQQFIEMAKDAGFVQWYRLHVLPPPAKPQRYFDYS